MNSLNKSVLRKKKTEEVKSPKDNQNVEKIKK